MYRSVAPVHDDGILLAQKTVDAALYENQDSIDDVVSDQEAEGEAPCRLR